MPCRAMNWKGAAKGAVKGATKEAAKLIFNCV